ncbi:hypothetical protein C5B94_03265 [Clavibacter michiganensis]|uniref:hypothetical protein n=1 Tax=Clavibacter michiganensis TaxID=28447 RepID=UPI000CE89729|nr:hypothetical protein [Clavibacter michiganensis]PPF56453.1 hypothetical protein C5B94_03265 [Clavibacter michiganensis]
MRTDTSSPPRTEGRVRSSRGVATTATGFWILVFCFSVVWIPKYVTGFDGMLLFFPFYVPISFVSMGLGIAGLIRWATTPAGYVAPRWVPWLAAVAILAPYFMLGGNMPLELLGID